MIFISFLLTVLAHAGHELGNGADAVVCADSVELLDRYEMREISQLDLIDMSTANGYLEIAGLAMDQLGQQVPLHARGYREAIRLFESEATFVTGAQLVDIPDSQHPVIPEGCELKQLVNQRTPRFPGQHRYIVDKVLWNQLSELDKAMLVVHEVLYRQVLEDDSRNSSSEGIRYLNSTLFSRYWKQIDEPARFLFLEKAIGVTERQSFAAIGRRDQSISLSGDREAWGIAGNFSSQKNFPFDLVSEIGDHIVQTPFGRMMVTDGVVSYRGHWSAKSTTYTPSEYSMNDADYREIDDFHINLMGQEVKIATQQMKWSGDLQFVELEEATNFRWGEDGGIVSIRSGQLEVSGNEILKIHQGRVVSPGRNGTLEYASADITFHRNGVVASLANIQNETVLVWIRVAGQLPFLAMGQSFFHPEGRELLFHEDGLLKRGVLAANASVPTRVATRRFTVQVAAYRRVFFDDQGWLVKHCANGVCLGPEGTIVD